MEVIVEEPVVGQPIDVRRLDETAEGAQMAEARVVQQEDHDVRRTGRRLRGAWPPLLGVLVALGDLALEDLAVLREGLLLLGMHTDREDDHAAEGEKHQHPLAHSFTP